MPTPELAVTPVSGALGAEIRGVDLTELTDELFEHIHELLLEHLVVFFPDQEHLTPEAHIALGRRLGELEVHPFLPKADGHPEIVVLDADQGAKADEWHIDVTFQPNPPVASILHLQVCPASGGDTMWSNQYLVYETLSEPMRELLDGLTAVHVLNTPQTGEHSAEHPVVRIHPETGRRSLYVTRMWTSHIPQLSRPESDALLQYLFEHSESPRFNCRYRWQPGAVAMWDNRATQHLAVNDYTGPRRGQRVTVLGDHPTGDTPRWKEYRPAPDERYYPRHVTARHGYR
ncbi:TauD/TfdA family dioxygenase [Streptomyces sp. DR7-3]|uniref:TauD/TfdA dioxygenase family protein n=1 Tax=Streptomyces malaysiensis TaxID=92644 RepID=UPI002043CF56|nr:TauD/TfdA family dioxygenase [Streptomyces sp. DR7-3]MCM3804665.1 TauD/TfdA family dioxygenase [Streptomyces sp. DR7-3]